MSALTLGVVWNDGHHSLIPVRSIRLQCRCANCVDEWTREQLFDPSKIASDIKPVKMDTVGRYALRIQWSDGHDSGIYTFDLMRSLCECPECKKTQTSH